MPCRRAALAAALLLPSSLAAQKSFGENSGPYAPIIGLLPSGPRTLAMGNTGIASRDDDVLFFNPAQLVIARGFSVSYEHYSSVAGGGSLSAVTRFNNGGIGIGARVADYEMPLAVFPADRGSMLLGGPVPATSLEMSVGVGQVIKGVRVGAAGKYLTDNVAPTRVSRAALDLGVSKDLFRFYTVGLAVQNIGSSTTIPCSFQPASITDCPPPPGNPPIVVTKAPLPLRTTLGVATQRSVGELDLVATAAVEALRAGWLGGSAGAELGYSWLDGYSFALRGGVRRPLPGETPFTAGAGFNVDRLSIDYAIEALRPTEFFPPGTSRVSTRPAHRIGLRIR